MANHTLFSQAAPTGSNGGGGATTGTYGLQFSVSSAQTASGIWFYTPSGATALPDSIGIFDTNGSLAQLQVPSWSGAAGTGWVLATFNAPITLATSTQYVAAFHMPFSSGFWNVTDSTYWSSGAGASGITSGPITAPGNGAAVHGQNSYVSGTQIGFPTTSLAGNNIWMDIQTTDANANVHTVFSQVPNPNPSVSDNSTYTMGMAFTVSSACTSTAIWFYSPQFPTAAADIPTEVAIYDNTATSFLADQIPTWSGPQGGGWVRYQWSSPISLVTGHTYQVCVVKQGTGNNWYASQSHYWDTGPGASGITSGPLNASNDSTTRSAISVGQDSFHVGPSLTVPNGDFNATNYWVDVEVTSSGGPTAISVSDFAGMVEAPSISANIAVLDVAGVVEAIVVSTGTNIHVSDFAGAVEAPGITVTVPVIDIAAEVERLSGTITLSVSDTAAGLDILFNRGIQGTNLIRPAIVFMAATYPGNS